MSKHATVLQRQARGTATRKMMRQANAKSPGGPSAPSGAGGSPAGSVGGSPQPGRSPQQQISPYFNPTYTRTGWIGQPPVLDRHEVVTIDGDVVTLRQATP